MNDLITSESIENLEINSINCMDSLIDNLSHDMYLGKSLYVGINELPFWIQRFIAQQKKNKGHAPIIWTMGESTTCEIEDRIEVYFNSRFPNIEVIAFEANADIARELNQAFIEHGEYIDSKKTSSSANMGVCEQCGTDLEYNIDHDALYCEHCDVWKEKKCSSRICEYCTNRPSTPSICNNGGCIFPHIYD